jgi:hypothetical protein
LAPIEVFFGVLVAFFGIIGLVRGFLKELGVTMVMVFLLFFLSRFEPYLHSGVAKVMSVGGRLLPTQDKNLLECWIFVLVLIGTAFISYEGETLAFGGQPPRGTPGIAVGALTGLFNGYLIAGSLWYYMDKFNYPIAFLGFTAERLSAAATTLIPFLPIAFLGQPILLGQSFLLYLCAVLFLARVIR